MRKVALATSEPSTETDAADDIAEHSPTALLAQHLRTTRYHIAQAIAAMREVVTLSDGNEGWAAHLEQLGRIASFVEDRCALFDMGQRSFLLPDQVQHFATLLQKRRESAHLSRVELGKRAGLSDRTIKNIEHAQTSPSRDTVVRLLDVAELGLTWTDVLGDPVKQEPDSTSENGYNCYIPHGYDSVGMVLHLAQILNGPGGHVEQTNAYLEHRSAIAYVAMGNDPAYVARYRAIYPLAELARRLSTECGQSLLKVIALGPGDGNLEVRFVQLLLDEMTKPDIELVLFDISQPLLNTAYQHALDTFGEQSPVHTLMLQGTFLDLAHYPQVSYAPAKGRRRRIYTMLGNTLANLDNEPRFFKHCMSHCQPGDFLVLDIRQRQAAPDASEAEIRRADFVLRGPFSKTHADWLSTPIRTHCPDLVSCEFAMELETQCPIPGSYALDAVATVKTRDRGERRFSMFRFKSYDQAMLVQSLARFGWECLLSLPIGPQEHAPLAMLMMKREEGWTGEE
jgi:DNA-binding XRE family transcriptional regulator